MKSKVIFAIGIATMAAISCEKTDYVDPASPGTAIIKGTLFAPIDLSNDTTSAGTFVFGFKNEVAPAGIIVTATIDSEDLQKNPDPNFNYEILKYTTTVTSEGKFEFTNIPAYAKNLAVTLKFGDFEETQIQFDPSNNPSLTKIFSANNKQVTVYDGAIEINNYTYSAN